MILYIYMKILGYKPKKGRTPLAPSRVRKLKGVAPKCFTCAVAYLGRFAKRNQTIWLIFTKSINKIMVRSILFKHNFNAGGDDDEHEEAQQFLIQALGGIDDFLARFISIPWQNSEDKEANWSPVTFEWQLSATNNNNCLEYSRIRTGEPNLKFDIIISYAEANTLKREFVWVLPEHHQTRFMVDVFKIARQKYLEGGNLLPAFTVPYVSEVFMARDEEECTRLLQSAVQKQCNAIDLLNVEELGNTDILKIIWREFPMNIRAFRGSV